MELKFNHAEFNKDVAALVKKLETVKKEISQEVAVEIVTTCTNQLLKESVDRTPIDEGFLIASQMKKVEVGEDASSVVGHVFIPANSPASDYALPLHEGTYNLGAKSQQKQAGSSVVVGRKFLERALYENVAKFQTYIIKKLLEKLK